MNFHQETIQFTNTQDNITLKGTLTLPDTKNKLPAVLLITGYGPNDRDHTSSSGHKYFKVLAEHLTQQSIAVLRYDKRGVGESTGNWTTSTSADLARDACAGIEYLKTREEIDSHHIGVIGLSEGGLIATMVAAQSPDISFAVLMAPYVAQGIDLIIHQCALQLKADGASDEFVTQDSIVRRKIYTIALQEKNLQTAVHEIKDAIIDYAKHLPEALKNEAQHLPWALTKEKAEIMASTLTSATYQFLLHYDPVPTIATITIPLLILVGTLDLITPADKIFPLLKSAFEQSGHADYTFLELPHVNHVFQPSITGASAEYATTKETMAPIALDTITEWIKEVTQ